MEKILLALAEACFCLPTCPLRAWGVNRAFSGPREGEIHQGHQMTFMVCACGIWGLGFFIIFYIFDSLDNY